MKLKTSHLLTGEELSNREIDTLLDAAITLKNARKNGVFSPVLSGKTLAMLFDKPSLRTRFSFTVGMTELGGSSVESVFATRKKEEPEDVARVLAGYCHAIMIRTSSDESVERMAKASRVPVINGLSDLHHPCQILADLMTLKENFGKLQGVTLSYLGDGNNILHSLLLMAPQMGIQLRYACPAGYRPNADILKRAKLRAAETSGSIVECGSAMEAASNAHAVYTDVWTSMGFEAEEKAREKAFAGFQLNENLMSYAQKDAVVLHCLPMNRGKEISETLPDSKASVIFQQSENRLHAQKALLVGLMANGVT